MADGVAVRADESGPERDGPIDVEWPDRGRLLVGWRTAVAVAGLVVVALAFAYDYAVLAGDPVAFGYDVGRLQWLWVACLWVDLVYVGVPAVRNPGRTLAFVRRLRRRPVGFAAAIFVAVVFLAGTLGPVVLPQPVGNFAYGNQPPLFTSVDTVGLSSCHNLVDGRCHGSLHYPLGTNAAGKGLLTMIVFGARVVVELAVVSVTMIVPLATVAGTVAAYAGGRVDRAITTVAETLKAVPALLVFLLWRWVAADGSLFVLVLAFGLVNWGNVAVVVRSRALNVVTEDYVAAAEAGGAGALEVVADHLVPNVSRTAVSAAVYQVPLFVTIEATLSFLKFGDPPSFLLTTLPTQESWGRMIGRNATGFDPYWWRVAVPVLALLCTILALNLLANAVHDVLDAG